MYFHVGRLRLRVLLILAAAASLTLG